MEAHQEAIQPEAIESLQKEGLIEGATVFRGQQRLIVPSAHLHSIAERLKGRLGFDMLVDVTCVDYLTYPQRDAVPARFGLVYQLLHTWDIKRLTLRVFVGDDDPVVPSLVPFWESANWLEREVWDLFGIRFDGHPDLRRIVLPEAFSSHPLRKDYPLQGMGERHNFPALRRGEG